MFCYSLHYNLSYLVSHLELVISIFVAGNGKNGGKLTGRIIDSDMHDVARFLNRILGLFPDIQNRQVF